MKRGQRKRGTKLNSEFPYEAYINPPKIVKRGINGDGKLTEEQKKELESTVERINKSSKYKLTPIFS